MNSIIPEIVQPDTDTLVNVRVRTPDKSHVCPVSVAGHGHTSECPCPDTGHPYYVGGGERDRYALSPPPPYGGTIDLTQRGSSIMHFFLPMMSPSAATHQMKKCAS